MSEDLFPPEEKIRIPESLYPDFISSYVALVSGDPNNHEKFKAITDAPRDFIEASALFLLSTFSGPNIIYLSLPETNIFDEKPNISGLLLNLWFQIIGKSRITRKTMGVIKRIKDIIHEIQPALMLTAIFTPEFLIKEMSEMTEKTITGGQTHSTWVYDESLAFFEGLESKDYMRTADDLLSTLYTNETYERGTIGRSKETILNPYLTAFLASTEELPKIFTDRMFTKGLLNRFIYVIAKREKRLPRRTEGLTNEERNEANYIIFFLRALYTKTCTTAISLRYEAKIIHENYEKEIEDKIEVGDLGFKEGFYGNLPEIALKISCLIRISRLKIEEINAAVLIVEKEDVEKAISYCRKIEGWFLKMLDIRGQRKVETIEDKIEKVYRIILRAGVEGIEMTLLLNKSGMLKKDLMEILETLFDSNRVNKLEEKTGKPGRPATTYFATELLRR